MDRHVEVICFEGIRHFPKTLQTVLSCSLFKAKCFCRFLALLKKTKKKKQGRELENQNKDWSCNETCHEYYRVLFLFYLPLPHT